MKNKKIPGSNHKFFLSAGGVCLLLVLFSMGWPAGRPLLRTAFLMAGLAGLFISLITLQLNLFREGDKNLKKRDRTCFSENGAGPCFPGAKVPEALKNPGFRAIWKNLDETRRLISERAAKDQRAERRREKARLGLPREEEIQMIAEGSLFYSRPITALSLALILFSASPAGRGSSILSFSCSMLGLAGLLYQLITASGRRYYLTNFRILVLHKPAWKRVPSWTALNYRDLKKVFPAGRLSHTRFILRGAGVSLNIEGLRGTRLQNFLSILRNNAPHVHEGCNSNGHLPC